MSNLCEMCPGCGTVWVGNLSADTITWLRLVHVDSWRMVPNRQEATKKRTSDTGGASVKFCPDVTDWTFEVTNTLCITDWLYTDILETPINPSVGKTAWWYFGWGCDHAPPPLGDNSDPAVTDQTTLLDGSYAAITAPLDGGIYAYGTVNPPGFGIDNNGSDPATGDWTVEVSQGPFLPKEHSDGRYSGSNEVAGDDEDS